MRLDHETVDMTMNSSPIRLMVAGVEVGVEVDVEVRVEVGLRAATAHEGGGVGSAGRRAGDRGPSEIRV